VIPPVLRGERIAALAVTEPAGGSDVARIATRAVRDGDHWRISGEKLYITSGVRADWLTVAVRTGEPGARGLSMIVVPGDAPGLKRTPLRKMGWWCSDTAAIHFDDVRVPLDHLVGDEGAGFQAIMENFNAERLMLAGACLGFAEACLDEALEWTRQRHTFGAPLIDRQVVRHKLVDMHMRIASTQAWVEALAERADAGDLAPAWVAEVCMLKNHATQTMQFCADQAVQLLGGMGYMRGMKSERIYREVKVMMIGGGSEEIMKELAARQLGL
jgi:acyl-CoA dehydrogenase